MRSSNIELLRIASMFMIILFHFSVHGAWPEGGPLASDIAVEMLSFGGKLGVNCFVLITGYFMLSGRLKLPSLLRILFETWFYSWSIVTVCLLLQPELVTQEKLEKAVLPVVSGEYWFITCYICLMVVSPLLNLAWRHLQATGKSRVAAVGFVMLSLLPTASSFNPVGSDLLWFFYLYLLGGWIRELRDGVDAVGLCRLDPARFVGRWGAGRVAVLGVLFVWASMAVLGYAQRAWGFERILPDYFIWQYMVPTFLASVGLLLVFQKLNVGSIGWVNSVAKTTLGIYLIHDNPLVRAWVWPYFAGVYDFGFAGILGLGLLAGAGVFAVCSAIDFARITLLENPLFKWINRRFGPAIERANRWLALEPREGR